MISRSEKWRRWGVILGAAAAVAWGTATAAHAQDCVSLLNLFQQGEGAGLIAQQTGLTVNQVEICRDRLRQPILVGPAGPLPQGAAGPPPLGAGGPPPLGAGGPPPLGAAGPTVVNHAVKRLP